MTVLKLSTTKIQISVEYNSYIGYYEIHELDLNSRISKIIGHETNRKRAIIKATDIMRSAVQS